MDRRSLARCSDTRRTGEPIGPELWPRGATGRLRPAVPSRSMAKALAQRWGDEKLVLTVLEGRFRDACFCCARSTEDASDRSLSPPCEGGARGGGAGALEIENDCSRLARGMQGVLEMIGREILKRRERGKTLCLIVPWPPPQPPHRKGGKKRRNEIGMNAQLVQDRLFIAPALHSHGCHLVRGFSVTCRHAWPVSRSKELPCLSR